MLTEVEDSTFRERVLEAEIPVLVDFWGPRCGPCLALMPVVEALSREFQGRVRIVKVNATRAPQTCREHRVMALPAFIGFSGGTEVCRAAKEVSAQTVRGMLDLLTGKDNTENVEFAG
jgi:thioredoxin 1